MAEQKFGITTKKEESFSEWYQQVVIRSELLDYYDIRGCFIMRPASMYMWKQIQRHFDDGIARLGVSDCYFPMLVTRKNLEMEKDHLANFDPELAWITKCGSKVLDEPVALRPTSEAIIYPSYAKWLKTYRDLPLKLNQWCSVLRWEVKSTLPFIRGREFLWQEGHTAHYGCDDAETEAMHVLNLYAEVYRELLAVPVTKGTKSANETFGGAKYTLSAEAFIPGTGKGVQAATSHHLGQNFAKMYDIRVETEHAGADKVYPYQNSWGMTTRSLGIAVMMHSDNRGFVCPPRVAQTQIVVMMCGIKAATTAEERQKLLEYTTKVYKGLEGHFRVHFDDRDNVSPGHKFNHWEIRGVPIRVEIGFKDMASNSICVVRRDNAAKAAVSVENAYVSIAEIMNTMHNDMYHRAAQAVEERTRYVNTFDEFEEALANMCQIMAPWCRNSSCEDNITKRTTIMEEGEVVSHGAKSLCIPFDAKECVDKSCVNCGAPAACYTLFGRSY